MSPSGIRRRLRHHRHRAAAMAAMLVCAAAIVVHHSHADTDGHGEAVVSAMIETCAAAFTAVGAAVAAIGLALVAVGRWRFPMRSAPAGERTAAAVLGTNARAGPALLLLLCVSRR